jgi:hypothetical protein
MLGFTVHEKGAGVVLGSFRTLGLLLFPYRYCTSSVCDVPNTKMSYPTSTLSCSRRLLKQASRKQKSKKDPSWYMYERLNMPLGILEDQWQGLDRQKSPKPNYWKVLLISQQKQTCPAPLMLRPTQVGISNGF